MTCEHARALIDGFVLDELSAADARTLADHVRGCAACTAELAGASRLIELLATLPELAPSRDFDTRVLAAAFAERHGRHAQRGWLADLRAQILRGTLRTTGTLAATVALVALLAVGGVWAASTLFMGPLLSAGIGHDGTPRPTASAPAGTGSAPAAKLVPSATPVPAPIETPRVIVITVTPSPAPSARPTLRPSPPASPTPPPVVLAAPTAPPSAAPSASAASSPTPSPTPKCRRTPQGPLCYPASPSPSAAGPSSP